MGKGLATIARDNLKARVWDPLFAGWGGKSVSFDGTHDGILQWLNMATGIQGAITDPDNPIAQIKANKRTIQAVVKLIGSALATTPLRVYKTKEMGAKSNFRWTRVRAVPEVRKKALFEKATPGSALASADDFEEITGGHPLVDLLKNVNGMYDNFGLKQVTTQYMSLTGDAYWALIMNKLTFQGTSTRVPAAIWIAPSEYMKIKPDEDKGVSKYVYKRGTKKHEFEPEEIVHFRLYAPGEAYQFYGRGDVAGAADPFNLQEAIQQFETKVFKNGAFLGGVLSTTGRTTEAQKKKLKENFDTAHGSIANAGGWMVMENVEPKPLMMTPRELDYQDARKVLMEEMITNFAVPVAMLTGQVSTRAALEASLTQFALYSTAPFCTLMSEAMNAQLTPRYPGGIFVAFDDPVLPDKEFQLKQDRMHLQMGIETPDEIRGREGLEPFGGLSAEPWHNSNRVPVSMVGQFGQGAGQSDQEAAEEVNRIMDMARKMRVGG